MFFKTHHLLIPSIYLFLLGVFLFLLPISLSISAQTTGSNAESNEVITRVGDPPDSSGGACGSRVFYCQGDPKWSNECDMAGSGCGPTSMAMVLSSFGDTITPKDMDAIFRQRGWRGCGSGSTMQTAISIYLPEKGYTYAALPLKGGQLDLQKAKEYLDNGYLIIGSTRNHIFAMSDVTIANNQVILMDPARCENNPSVTRSNAAPWNGEGWYYAYAVKKEGTICETGDASTADAACDGTTMSFAQKKLLPKPSEPQCKNTATLTCGRASSCIKPTKIVMHTTVSPLDADGIYDYFAKGAAGRGVGTQFVIGKDGKIIQMVEMLTDKVEQSFGVAYYNDEAINIELTHSGVYDSKDDTPQPQYQAALNLVKRLMQQYKIPKGSVDYDWRSSADTKVSVPAGIFGHYQLNPSNRFDPGSGFLRDFREDL